MELEMPVVEVEKSATFEKKSFGIGDEAFILSILRSKMYSIPQRTVVCEYMSNARDAHREVGKDLIPIEVTLPDEDNNSVWSVRDFGPGITPDRMANVFLLYGNSTKRNDNTQTGGFGLGAKSGFSLSDSFSIETVTNETGSNIKRLYIAIIDPSQKGEVNLVSEEPTTEECGTKIVISVKPEDVQRFIKYTKEIGDYWDVRPTIVNGSDFEWTEHKHLYINKIAELNVNGEVIEKIDWTFNYGDGIYNCPVVCLDGIRYPLSPNVIENQDKIYHQDWIFYFKTGELKVTSNRESLDYSTPETTNMLNQKYKAASQAVISVLLKQVIDAPTFVDAKKAYHKLRTNLSIKQVVHWSIDNIEIDDEPINLKAQVLRIKRNSSYKNKGELNTEHRSHLNVCDDKSAIVINDEGTENPNRNRIRTLLDTYESVQVINNFGRATFDINGKQTNVEELKKNVEDSLAAGLKYLTPIKLSTVEKKKEPIGTSYNKTAIIRKVNPSGSYHAVPFLDTSLTLNDAGIYAITDPDSRKECKVFGQNCTRDQLANIKKFLGLDELYVINPSNAKRVGKGWVKLEVKLQEKVDEYNKANICREDEHNTFETISTYGSRQKLIRDAINNSKDLNSLAREYLNKSDSYKKVAWGIEGVSCVRHMLKATDVSTLGLKKLNNLFLKRYPVLFLQIDNISISELTAYINMKDLMAKYKAVDSQDFTGLCEPLCYS